MDCAAVCVHCGCPTQNYREKAKNSGDAPNWGMLILGFLIPLVGLIIWLMNKDTKPQMAKDAGKGALIGFIANLVISFLFAIIMVVASLALI